MTYVDTGHHDSRAPSSRLGARSGTLGLAAAIVLAAIAAGCGSAIDSASTTRDLGSSQGSGSGSGSGSGEGSEGGEDGEGEHQGGGTTGGGTTGGGTTGGGTSGGGTSGGGAAGAGVPCDVAQVLSTHCLSCHGQPVAGGAPMSLVTYADLTATSPGWAPATELARSIARMEDAQSPMPPGQPGAVSAAEIAILKTWLASGAPQGSCGGASGGGAPNPFSAPAQCTSGNTSNPEEGSGMAPGHACMSCHTGQGEAPHFYLAGTVYPSAHEPNDCQSTGVSGTTVEITDANGQVTSLSVGASGNFHSSQAIAAPYSAKLVFQGRERAMGSHQQSGDCNSCHTQAGANGAPGRLLLP